MNLPHAPRAAPRILDRKPFQCGPIEITPVTEDISHHPAWRIHSERHSVIVHQRGQMNDLETEIEGVGHYGGPASPSQVWLVPAGHSYASHAHGRTIDYVLVQVAPAALEALQARNHPSGSLQWCLGTRDEFLFGLVARAIRYANEGDDLSAMALESVAETMCWHLLGTYRLGRTIMPEPCGNQLNSVECQRLVEFVQDNLGARMTVDQRAGVVGLTANRLFLRFRKAFGASPAQYVLSRRLDRARWLLANSTIDITQIALEAGFNSHSHLTAMLKSKLGVTPSQVRSTHR